MMLAQIERGPGGADMRTFECLKCEHVQKMLVGDPLKSANTGWTAGGFRPPKYWRRSEPWAEQPPKG